MTIITPDKTDNSTAPATIKLHWVYFWLPAVFLVLSVILAIVSLPLLPETVAWGFKNDTPTGTMSRTAFAIWTVVPQLFCFVLAMVIVRITLLGARYWGSEAAIMKKLILVMGNLFALPQVIILFALLDIFLYNTYQISTIPVWLFAVIILVVGVIYLTLFFIKSIRQVRRLRRETFEE